MSEFTVKVEDKKRVCWQSAGHEWGLHAHRLQGSPMVDVLIDERLVISLDEGEAQDLSRALGLLLVPEADTDARGKKGKNRPAAAGKPWPPEHDEELARRWTAGEPSADLAKHFQRSRNAILARLVTIGLEPDLAAAQRAERDGTQGPTRGGERT